MRNAEISYHKILVYARTLSKAAGDSAFFLRNPRLFSQFLKFVAPFPFHCRVSSLKRLVNEDDIIPNFINAVPRNIIFLPSAEQSEKAAGAINNDCTDLSFRKFNVQIGYTAETAAVIDVNYFFAPHIEHSALHGTHLSETYAPGRMSYADGNYLTDY